MEKEIIHNLSNNFIEKYGLVPTVKFNDLDNIWDKCGFCYLFIFNTLIANSDQKVPTDKIETTAISTFNMALENDFNQFKNTELRMQ